MTIAEAMETLRQLQGRAEFVGERGTARLLKEIRKTWHAREVIEVAERLKSEIPGAFPS